MIKMKVRILKFNNKKQTKRIFSKQLISNPGKIPRGYDNPQWLADRVRDIIAGAGEGRCLQKAEKKNNGRRHVNTQNIQVRNNLKLYKKQKISCIT